MLELEKTLEEMAGHLQESKRGYTRGWENFRDAEKAYKRIEGIRNEILQNVLKEKGLAVCSGQHYFTSEPGSEEWKTKTAEELGIFPKSQMKLRFVQGTVSSTDHFTDTTSEWMTQEVLFLCPRHFQQKYFDLFPRKHTPMIYSEVAQSDGKYIITSSGSDITALVKGGRHLHFEMELDGKTNPDVAVYRFFGIPDLPAQPDLSMVR